MLPGISHVLTKLLMQNHLVVEVEAAAVKVVVAAVVKVVVYLNLLVKNH